MGDVTLLDENTYSPLNVDVDLGLRDGFSDLVTPGEIASQKVIVYDMISLNGTL